MATHAALSVEQIADIQKNLLVSLRDTDTFWDKFCGHDTVAKGLSSLEWRKLNVKSLGLADIKNLTEGVTPDGIDLEYLKFRVGLTNFGTYIPYTDESERFNYDDVVQDAKLVLGQHVREQLEIRKSQAFAATTCSMTVGAAANTIKDLRKARTILIKNKVKPLNAGRYAFICTPEQASDILEAMADKITHTSQKEAVIKGYIGELAGFVIYENADPIMYSKEGKGLCFFVGKTDYGMPVRTVAFGDSSVQVYDNGLGSGVSKNAAGEIVSDHNHQHGSVAYKVMGFATRILFDEAVIKGEYTLTNGIDGIEVADANRFGYVETSPAN